MRKCALNSMSMFIVTMFLAETRATHTQPSDSRASCKHSSVALSSCQRGAPWRADCQDLRNAGVTNLRARWICESCSGNGSPNNRVRTKKTALDLPLGDAGQSRFDGHASGLRCKLMPYTLYGSDACLAS